MFVKFEKWKSEFGVKSTYGLRIVLIYSLIMMTLNNLYNAFLVGALPNFIYLIFLPYSLRENMLVAGIAGLIAIVLASMFFYIYFKYQKSGDGLFQRPQLVVAIASLILGIVVWANGGMTLLLRFFGFIGAYFDVVVPYPIVQFLFFVLSTVVCSIGFLLVVAKIKGSSTLAKKLKESIGLILSLSLIAAILIMAVSWIPNHYLMTVDYPYYSINYFTQTFSLCLIFHLIYIRMGKLMSEDASKADDIEPEVVVSKE